MGLALKEQKNNKQKVVCGTLEALVVANSGREFKTMQKTMLLMLMMLMLMMLMMMGEKMEEVKEEEKDMLR